MEITAVVLAFNEEKNISSCLSSVRNVADYLFVVDSYSTDGTAEISKELNAIVVQHPFESHARQWAWALNHLPIQTEWVLALDADQRLSPELKKQLLKLKSQNSVPQDGFFLKRKYYFLGKWIRFGGYYPKLMMKFFKKDKVRLDEMDLVDHRFYLCSKRAGYLAGDLIEENLNDATLAVWWRKQAGYARKMAQESLLRKRNGRRESPIPARFFGNPDERILWLKRCWDILPRYVRPFLYFCFRYVMRAGFLDGRVGFIFHGLQGFGYRMLVDYYMGQERRTFAQGERK